MNASLVLIKYFEAMKKLLYLLTIVMCIPFFAQSQLLIDGYRLSSQQVSGTARAAAMGNAFGALGGDFTSLSLNPAGVAIYQSSELVFTPSVNINQSEAQIGSTTFSDNKYKQNFNNIGYVGSLGSGTNESGIINFSFGLGYNRVLDYNQSIYGGYNQSAQSFLDGIANWANSEALANSYLDRDIGNVEYRDWPAKLAWDTYLINPAQDNQGNEIDGSYVNLLYSDEKVKQQMNYIRKGGIEEYLFAGGLNFYHKFYIGATIGIQDVNITQLKEYTEFLEDNNQFSFFEDSYLRGTGFNLKIGAIYKPINSLRLGFAFHTPTYFELNEKTILAIESKLLEDHYSEGINEYDYNFSSPYRFIFSGAYVFGKSGLLSVDAEYLDYTSMKYKNGPYGDSFSDLNNSINSTFNSVLNIRVGGEVKVLPQLSLRGGYMLNANPYKSSDLSSETIVAKNNSAISCGLGYASNNFFADFAFVNSTQEYTEYSVQPNFDGFSLKNSNQKLLLTLGFKF